jgi:hypothetical protein
MLRMTDDYATDISLPDYWAEAPDSSETRNS